MNNPAKSIIVIFLLFPALVSPVLTSCSDDEDDSLVFSHSDPPVVTGYRRVNAFGDLMGRVDNPNIRIEHSEGGSVYSLVVFPNPSQGTFRIYIVAPPDSSRKRIQVVHARPSGESTTALSGNATFSRSYGSTVFQNEFVNDRESTHMMLQIEPMQEKLPEFYKLYLEVDDVLLWDNIVIQP